MYNIKTFTKDDKIWYSRFEVFRNNIQDTHYRIKNYKEDWRDDGHLAYSVFLDNNEIYGFSTVYSRKFYPNKHARILNKYYISPSHRDVHINKRINRSTECATSQVKWCLENSDLDVVFISYEGYKPYWIKTWTKLINKEIASLKLSFKTDDKFYQTCDTQTKLCWQHVAHACLTEKTLKLNSINYNRWKILEDE